MRPLPTLLVGLAIVAPSLLLGGCSGGDPSSAPAASAPTAKPMTPAGTAAAAKRYQGAEDVPPELSH